MTKFIFALVFVLSATGCKKDEVTSNKCDIEKTRAENLIKRTISEGVYGTVGLVTGDCMPIVDPKTSSCKHCPVKRIVQVYEYTTTTQAVRSTTPPYYYDHFTTQKLAEIEADEKGFYEINIGPGHYTIVTMEDGKIYANGFDRMGGINSINIESNVALRTNLTVSKAVY